MAQPTCSCGSPATNRIPPLHCNPCRIDRVRRTEQRIKDNAGCDEALCVWCGGDNSPRLRTAGSPKLFCRQSCSQQFKDTQARLTTKLVRRCSCGAVPTSRTGIPYCDPCRQAAKRRWVRAGNLAKYGLTIEDYDKILLAQGGRCAVCSTTEPGHESFTVDHCHRTNLVRGLLCRNCNSGIGLLGDDVSTIRAAADYVERHR